MKLAFVIGPIEKIRFDVESTLAIAREAKTRCMVLRARARIPGADISNQHDLRIIMINGNYSCSYARIAGQNQDLSNLSQGGRIQHIPRAQLPDSAINLARRVDDGLNDFPRAILVLICFFVDDEPTLIELTTGATLSNYSLSMPDWFREYVHDTCDLLIKMGNEV